MKPWINYLHTLDLSRQTRWTISTKRLFNDLTNRNWWFYKPHHDLCARTRMHWSKIIGLSYDYEQNATGLQRMRAKSQRSCRFNCCYSNEKPPLFLCYRNDPDSVSPTMLPSQLFSLILVTLYASFFNLSHMLVRFGILRWYDPIEEHIILSSTLYANVS